MPYLGGREALWARVPLVGWEQGRAMANLLFWSAHSSTGGASALEGQRQRRGDQSGVQKSGAGTMRNTKEREGQGRSDLWSTVKSGREASLLPPRGQSPATRKALETEQFTARSDKPNGVNGIADMKRSP